MKKLLALLCAAVLVFSTAACVFAQPSKEIDGDVDFDTDGDDNLGDNENGENGENGEDGTGTAGGSGSSSSSSSSSQEGVSPKTGEMPVALYAGMIAMISLAGMSIVVYNSKRA